MAERPKDLIYALDERPPALQLLALGFQHAAVICPYLVMVALVANAAKLPQAAARDAMGLAMIAVAFLTILQSLRLRGVGSGYLCPPVVSAIYLPSSMAAASAFGLPVGDDGAPLSAATFDDFFIKQAKEWKIPEEEARRVRSVVDEAIELAGPNAQGPVEIRAGSDSFDVSITLTYTGNLPALPDARPKREMVEEQSFVSGLNGYLSGLHADRIERSAKGEACEIKLLFRL